MNNKSKGTTLIEILISVTLIAFIMVFLFNILVNMKQEYNLISKRSEDSINRAVYTRIIQNYLETSENLKMTILNSSNNNKISIKFTSSNNVEKYLNIENVDIDGKKVGRVTFGQEGWYLSEGVYDIKDVKFTYIEQKYLTASEKRDDDFLNLPDGDYHLLKIIIPVSYDILSSRKLDFEISHYGTNILVDRNFCNETKNNIFRLKVINDDMKTATNIKCENVKQV